MHYVVDTTKKTLETEIYDLKTIRKDLKALRLKSVSDLIDYNWQIFSTEEEAELFISKYNKVLKNLHNDFICESRQLPNLLYKRKYLVLTLLGVKSHTVRSYRKDWQPGQKFNLYDQTYFLTVTLKKISEVDGKYRYDFEL